MSIGGRTGQAGSAPLGHTRLQGRHARPFAGRAYDAQARPSASFCICLRASFLALRTASAFLRWRFSDGFS